MANLPITLYDGMKIGQISFQRLSSPVEVGYGDARIGSKYRGQTDPTASRYHRDFDRGRSSAEPAVIRVRLPEPLHAIEDARSRLRRRGTVRVVRAGWFRPDAGGFFGVVPRALGAGWPRPTSAGGSSAA